MRTQVGKWGNSLAVRLPRQITEAAGLVEGAAIDVEITEDGAVRIRSARPKFTLTELLAGITPESIPDEIFDDGPKGEELI